MIFSSLVMDKQLTVEPGVHISISHHASIPSLSYMYLCQVLLIRIYRSYRANNLHVFHFPPKLLYVRSCVSEATVIQCKKSNTSSMLHGIF